MNEEIEQVGTISVKRLFLTVLLFATPCVAEPMHFEIRQTGGNHCCFWIQAFGEITEETPKAFEAFLDTTKSAPGVVRFDSPGGNLIGGITLGEVIRARGFATEVGSSKFNDYLVPGGTTKIYSQEPGTCASACAYAFLGGVERSFDSDSHLGFHRFYIGNALSAPTAIKPGQSGNPKGAKRKPKSMAPDLKVALERALNKSITLLQKHRRARAAPRSFPLRTHRRAPAPRRSIVLSVRLPCCERAGS
jgi:hypothetical protein